MNRDEWNAWGSYPPSLDMNRIKNLFKRCEKNTLLWSFMFLKTQIIYRYIISLLVVFLFMNHEWYSYVLTNIPENFWYIIFVTKLYFIFSKYDPFFPDDDTLPVTFFTKSGQSWIHGLFKGFPDISFERFIGPRNVSWTCRFASIAISSLWRR